VLVWLDAVCIGLGIELGLMGQEEEEKSLASGTPLPQTGGFFR